MPRSKAARSRHACSSAHLFSTANLNFAAYLYATGRLVFDHAEPYERHSKFYFHDPEEAGPSIWTEYCTQDLKVSAKLLLESRTALLNEIKG